MQKCLISLWFFAGLALACDPVATTSLHIDTAATSDGNGSECAPFSTFAAALDATIGALEATLIFLEDSEEGTIDRPFTVQGRLTVIGAPTILLAEATLTVGETAYLELHKLSFSQQGASGITVIVVIGEASLQDCHFDGVIGFTFEGEDGQISFRDSTFTNSRSTVARVHVSSFNATFHNCDFRNITGDVLSMHTESGPFEGNIEFEGGTFQNISGKLINYLKEVSSPMKVTMSGAKVSQMQDSVFGGILQIVTISVTNSTFSDLRQVLSSSLTRSSLSFDFCDFLSIAQPLLQPESLLGQISITNGNIKGLQGQVVLMPRNVFSSVHAFIILRNLTIVDLVNLSTFYVGGVLNCASVTVEAKNLTVFGLKAYRTGFMRLVTSSALLSSIHYFNSSVRINSFIDMIACTVTVRDVRVSFVEINTGLISSFIATTGLWDGVVVTDMQDTLKIHAVRAFIIVWSGYGSFFTVQNCYFRNPGSTAISMAATNFATLTLHNVTFVDQTSLRIFDILETGFINASNLHFVRLNVVSVFTCVQTANCYSVSDVRFSEVIKLTNVMSIVNGHALLYNSTFDSLPTAAYFSIFNGRLNVANLTITNSKTSLMQVCINAEVVIDGLSVRNLRSSTFLQAYLSNITLSNSLIDGLTTTQFVAIDMSNFTLVKTSLKNCVVDSFGGLITAETGSLVRVTESSLSGLLGLLSMKMGLIYVVQSHLFIESSTFQYFNATMVDSVGSSVAIVSSVFSDGGLDRSGANTAMKTYGGVLSSEGSTSIEVTGCRFQRMSADFGGVLYYGSTELHQVIYAFNDASDCFARQLGGVIYGKAGNLNISHSLFARNTAMSGGAIALLSSSLHEHLLIAASEWVNNTATINGGAIYHLDCELDLTESVMRGNTAVYGNDIATRISYVAVVNATSPDFNFTLTLASGQPYTQVFTLGNFDMYNQLRISDNSTQLTLFSPDIGVKVEGSVLLTAKQGRYEVTNLIVIGAPESVIELWGQVEDVNNFLFSIVLRECWVGEFFNNKQCIPCTHNTYSFSPTEACTLCPTEAECTEGYKLTLSAGYWRSSTLTDHIYECIVPRLCEGGFESNCIEGHEGKMCIECESGYFKLSQLQCLSCYHPGIASLKALVAVFLSLGTAIFATSKGTSSTLVHLVVLDYFRILRICLNFNLYWPQALSVLFTLLGDIGSFGLTAFTDSCVGDIVSADSVFSQLLVAAIYLALLPTSLTLFLCMVPRTLLKSHRRSVHLLLRYVTYSLIPMMFLRVFQLFSCLDVDGQQRLTYNPSIVCWEAEHVVFVLIIALPVLIFSVLLPSFMLVQSRRARNSTLALPAVYLIRSTTLTAVLMFSGALALSSQVAISLIINIGTELLLCKLDMTRNLFGPALYQSGLIATVLLSFVCALYWGKQGSSADPVFVFAVYTCASIPLWYTLAAVVSRRRSRVYAEVQRRASRDFSSADLQAVVDDSSIRSSNIVLQVPNPTPLQSPK